jgi:hypothetical protein
MLGCASADREYGRSRARIRLTRPNALVKTVRMGYGGGSCLLAQDHSRPIWAHRFARQARSVAAGSRGLALRLQSRASQPVINA